MITSSQYKLGFIYYSWHPSLQACYFLRIQTVKKRNSTPMIHSRAQPINQAQANLLRHYINHIHSEPFHTLRSFKPRRERPQNPTRKPLRKPIPFITNIKEVEAPDDALILFNEYAQMGFKHDYPSYSALIYKLARSRKFEAVETILSHIRDKGIRCRETLLIALMEHYGKSNLIEKAMDLFHKMRSFNCVRTLQSFNAILNVLVDNDRFVDASSFFDRSYKMGFKRNSISFNIMIKGWLKKGDWEEACKVFDEMLEKEVQPSVVTYNSLIGFLCRKGDLDKAMSLLGDMTQKGKHPNAVTYALLMEGLCSLGKHKEAKKMMFDMEYRGCKPRAVNFGILISDLGKKGNFEEAKSMLNEMKQKRLKPDVAIYNMLINCLCKEGRVAEAYKILVEMQLKGCEPNAATYRMMVDGFCGARDFEGGLGVLNAMLLSRHCPRDETFCCLFVGLFECGRIDDACYVMEEMEKRKIRFGLKVWEALVRDYCSGDGVVDGLLSELVAAH